MKISEDREILDKSKIKILKNKGPRMVVPGKFRRERHEMKKEEKGYICRLVLGACD